MWSNEAIFLTHWTISDEFKMWPTNSTNKAKQTEHFVTIFHVKDCGSAMLSGATRGYSSTVVWCRSNNIIDIVVKPATLRAHPFRQPSTSHRLYVPPVRLSTVGRRAFPVSGATVWNDLPLHIASAPSLAVFRQWLKTFLFSRSYQDTIIWLVCYYHNSSLLSGHPWSLQ